MASSEGKRISELVVAFDFKILPLQLVKMSRVEMDTLIEIRNRHIKEVSSRR